jgi:GntR family transcriptional regulator/MocR family aminotransferase
LQKHQTNFPDWSALIPVLPAGGPRREALQAELRRLIETRVLLPGQKLPPSRELALSCCRFRGHEDKIVTKELEIGYDETEVQP